MAICAIARPAVRHNHFPRADHKGRVLYGIVSFKGGHVGLIGVRRVPNVEYRRPWGLRNVALPSMLQGSGGARFYAKVTKQRVRRVHAACRPTVFRQNGSRTRLSVNVSIVQAFYGMYFRDVAKGKRVKTSPFPRPLIIFRLVGPIRVLQLCNSRARVFIYGRRVYRALVRVPC